MDFCEYQARAFGIDQDSSESAENDPGRALQGLAGEIGSFIDKFEASSGDESTPTGFSVMAEEEIGNLLRHLANIATRTGLDLNLIAEQNLQKDFQRRPQMNQESLGFLQELRPFDEQFSPWEQLPRKFRVRFNEEIVDGRARITLTMEDRQFGDQMTDNAYVDDGYRFHDVFHLSFATILGWSPITRKLLRTKRKSDPRIDEVEDGGRASVIEEAICAIVFEYARDRSYLESAQSVDSVLLKRICDLSAHLEVGEMPPFVWEYTILEAYRVWRQMRRHRGGVFLGDLNTRSVEYEAA